MPSIVPTAGRFPGAATGARGADQRGEPTGERVRVLEVAELAERETERFLRGVGRAVPVTGAGHGQTDREVLEASDQLRPRRVLAPLRGFDHDSHARLLRHRLHAPQRSRVARRRLPASSMFSDRAPT